MRHHIGATAIVLAVAHAAPGIAAEISEAKRIRLTLDAALLRGEAESPLVRSARSERRVAEARRVGASVVAPTNPVVALTVGRRVDDSGSSPPAAGFEWGVRLEQSLEVGGQRGARLAEARRGADVALARERLARVETRARVRAAYIAALIARSHVESAKLRESLGARVLESATSRATAGAASDVELGLAKVELGRAMHERIEAELGALAADTALVRLLMLAPDCELELTTPLGPPPTDGRGLAQLLLDAHRLRQDVEVLERTKLALDATLTRLSREIIPNATLFADIEQQQPGQTFYGGGVGIALPVFRRNQGEKAVVTAQQASTDDELDVLNHDIGVEVVALHRSVAARKDELALWTERIVPETEKNLELVTQGWKEGKFDVFRVVQIARDSAEARSHELAVMGALWETSIELGRATGGQ